MATAPIYADHAATSPCRPQVAAAMQEWLTMQVAGQLGNPSARHHLPGRRARGLIDSARQHIANAIGARDPDEIIFTSGATESCNLALLGAGSKLLHHQPVITCPTTEHPAVLQPLHQLHQAGAQLKLVPVQSTGQVHETSWQEALTDQCSLACAMLVNNETGVILPVQDLFAQAHSRQALCFCDATQALGRVPINVQELGCDLLAISSHKIGGPQGVGALWIRRGLSLHPLVYGGGQERGLRSGTEHVIGIAGFGLAAQLAIDELQHHRQHLQQLTEQCEQQLQAICPAIQIHGAGSPRAPGTSFVSQPGLHRGLLAQLSGIAASSGSSCASGTGKASHVLQAMGISEAEAGNAVRLSFGASNTSADIDQIVDKLTKGIARLQQS